MISYPYEIETWVKNVIGKKLFKINGLFYFLEKRDLDNPQQLQLFFNGYDGGGVFCCGKNGSTLNIINSPMKECNLGEYGRQEIVDLSESEFFFKYVDLDLVSVYSVYSETEESFVGVKLLFSDDLSFSIINLGDEINVFQEIPLQYEEEEKFKYIRIKTI